MNEIKPEDVIERLNKLNSLKNILYKNIFINWFFLVKPHPFFLKKYNKFYFKNSKLFYLVLKNFLKLILIFIINIFKNKLTVQNYDKKKFDFVFISHFISNDKIFQKDPYFKEIYKILKKQNKSFFIVYLNHNKKLIKNKLLNQKNFLFLKNNLSLKNEIKCIIEIFSLFLFYTKHDKIEFKDKLIIIGEILSQETLSNIRLSLQIKKLFKKIKFENLISTFEGYNFEKIIFHHSKTVNKKNKNIGYQHASIIKNQLSIFDFQDTEFYPDEILTTGSYYKNIFQNNLKNKKIRIIGSSKIDFNTPSVYQKTNYCLVLPEAILDECKILFNFTLNYTKKYNNLKFIWRLHPMMKMDQILNQLEIKIDNKNIILSSGAEDDFVKSKYSLYRGSTSIFQSIKFSNIPLYLMTENHMNIDPLFNLKIKNEINSIEDLYLFTNKSHKNDQSKYLIEKVNEYFEKPNQYELSLL